MERYWLTKNDEEIEYKKLEDDHLLNILKWIKKRAKDGMVLEVGGCGPEESDYWHDSWEIRGDEVLEHYDYEGLLGEAKRRKLI
jgi:hypothetical protein